MKKRDLTHQQFGDLFVIDEASQYVSPKGYRKTMWNCICGKCGKMCTVMGSHLISGHSTSCGCQKLSGLEPRKAGDLTGRRFGMLRAMYRMPNRQVGKNSRVVWHCACDCGKETDVLALLLQEGFVKSCGCLSVSHAERIMNEYLAGRGLKFITQYAPDGLHGVGGGVLKFDIAIFECDVPVLLIELDGAQHYGPVAYFGGNRKYEQIKANDALKDVWAKRENIRLIRIDVSSCNSDADFIAAYDLALSADPVFQS